MLGDKVGVLTGKVTGTRVLNGGHGPKVETTFEVSGELGGTGTTMIGTYWGLVQPDGSLYGECPDQGVLMTADGGVGTWTAAGRGRFTGDGSGTMFRGAVYLLTAPESLSDLAHSALIYEWEVDKNQDATLMFWEWK